MIITDNIIEPFLKKELNINDIILAHNKLMT